jgi:hypothetical protein
VLEPSAASCSLRESCHGEAANFRDDRAEPAMAKAFFETGEDRFLLSWFDIDHPIRCKPG